jgi:HEPN domain-containing protein
MPSKEFFLEQIEKEFASAREALKIGNDGKARVCARRAAGQALTWFLTRFPKNNWGTDVLSQLLHLKDDSSFPQEVRDAAKRLTTKVSDRFNYPFSSDPIHDANLIIQHIEQLMNENAS